MYSGNNTWLDRMASENRERGIPEHMYVAGEYEAPESIQMWGGFLGFTEEQLQSADLLKIWGTSIKHSCPDDGEFEIYRLYRGGRAFAEKRKRCRAS